MKQITSPEVGIVMHDVIVIGGSYAGLSAALQLGRARRAVVVVDAGIRRNRFADHSHGFLTRDGAPPAEIAAIAREQVRAYPTVQWRDGSVTHAEAADGGFRVVTDAGEELLARQLVLATGVRDHLPEVPGLAERWGKHVFHCPYCHGYELDQAPVGVLATSPISMHHALMLPDWGPTTFFLNGVFEPSGNEREQLARRGVTVEAGLIERVEGRADVVMRDGRVISVAGIFVASRMEPATPVGHALGCEMDESPAGTVIKTDGVKATSVPGVFACGDVARMGGSVAMSVADGAMAGSAAHRALIQARAEGRA